MAHCDEALRRIGRAIENYQQNCTDRNPIKLEELIENGLLNQWDLICPVSKEGPGECSYEYRGDDLYGGVPKEMVVAYDKRPCHKGRRNILFASGQVSRQPEKIFQKSIEKDNQLRRLLNLPQKRA